jgi:hypothetical protein
MELVAETEEWFRVGYSSESLRDIHSDHFRIYQSTLEQIFNRCCPDTCIYGL